MSLTFETEDSKDLAERRWTFLGIVSFLLVLGALFVFVSLYWGKRSANLDSDLILGIIATTAVLILATTYFYAYRFFRDVFYLFICIGWFANAFYLPFEFFISPAARDFQFDLNVYYAGFVLNLPFFLSIFVPFGSNSNYRRLLLGSGILVGSLVLSTLLVDYLVHGAFQNANPMWKFALLAVPGVYFASFTYFMIGRRIGRRLNKEIHGRLPRFLSGTFYAYASLQWIYPLKLYLRSNPEGQVILLIAFATALVIKISNNVSLLGVLLSTVTYPSFIATQQRLEKTEEQLLRRSQLEELGALASSIEHDMKSPIGEMSLIISTMRRQFQSQSLVLNGLDKLENAKKRMGAIAKVVQYLRGDKAFYDRERFMEKVSVLESIHRAVKTVKSELNLNPDKILIKVEGKDVFTRAYPPMLEQVIVNAIKNGLEAIFEAKRKRGLIRLRAATVRLDDVKDDDRYDKKYDKWVRIEIADNGCGILPENIPKVTTLFTTRGEDKANSGIGMFIGYRIMKVHSGFIDIRSVVGQQTKVSLLLPEWSAYLRAVSKKDEKQDDELADSEEIEAVVAVVADDRLSMEEN